MRNSLPMREVGLEPTRVSPRDPKSARLSVAQNRPACDASATGGVRSAIAGSRVRNADTELHRFLHRPAQGMAPDSASWREQLEVALATLKWAFAFAAFAAVALAVVPYLLITLWLKAVGA